MKPFLGLSALLLSLIADIAHAGSLSVSNLKGFASNPIVDCNGSPLTGADPVVVAVGTFASEPASAVPNAGQAVFSHVYQRLLAEFTPYGAPGALLLPAEPLNLQGVFSFQDNLMVTGTPLADKPVYVVIACGADLAAATQVAILKVAARFEADDDGSPFAKLVGVGTTLGTVTIVGSETRFTAAATTLDTSPDAAYSLAEIVPSPEISVEQPSGTILTDGTAMIDFGTVAVGAAGERTFTIRNVGGSDLKLTGTPVVAIDGTGASDFTVLANPATLIPHGDQTTFTVRFTPSREGPQAAALRIASNDEGESPFDIDLTGTRASDLSASFNSREDVGLTVDALDARGLALSLALGFRPTPDTYLTVINNTGTGPITGTLGNLADGGMIGANYGGRTYYFIADYSGGDGNDLVLALWTPAASAILVADGAGAAVLRYDWATAIPKTFIPASAFIGAPQGMAIGPDGKLYVLDTDFATNQSRILKFDVLSGKNLGTFVATGTGINRGSFLAFDSAGNAYVQQDIAPMVVKFHPDGTPTGTLFATRVALLATGLGVGPDGLIYLAIGDGGSGLADIIRCSPDGAFVDTFVNDLGNFNGYRKPVWDSLGHLYAANLNDGMIRKFDATSGALLSTLNPPANGYVGLCLVRDGTLMVGDVWNEMIYRIAPDGTNLGTFASNVLANDMIPQPSPTVYPEIVVEQPAGIALVYGTAAVDFGTDVVGGHGTPVLFTIRNDDYGDLTNLALAIVGPAAGDFAIAAANLPATLASGESATFSVTFAPVTSGALAATLRIASNDADENPFNIDLTGLALSFVTDSDGDGLNDATEWKMAMLGFDWQKPQPALVATLLGNAQGAGLFTRAALDNERTAGRSDVLNNPNAYSLYTRLQLQALKPDAPLISRDPTSGIFTLKMSWKKSTDLADFMNFPATPAGVSVTEEGDIKFEFSSPDGAAFFRLETGTNN